MRLFVSHALATAAALALGLAFAGEAFAQKVPVRTKLCCSACQFSQWIPDKSVWGGHSVWLNPPRCVGGVRVPASSHCPWGKTTCG